MIYGDIVQIPKTAATSADARYLRAELLVFLFAFSKLYVYRGVYTAPLQLENYTKRLENHRA